MSNYLIHRLLRWITELPAEKEMYFLGSLSNSSIHLKFSITEILKKVFCVCISAMSCTAALLPVPITVPLGLPSAVQPPWHEGSWIPAMQRALLVEINLTSSKFFSKISDSLLLYPHASCRMRYHLPVPLLREISYHQNQFKDHNKRSVNLTEIWFCTCLIHGRFILLGDRVHKGPVQMGMAPQLWWVHSCPQVHGWGLSAAPQHVME